MAGPRDTLAGRDSSRRNCGANLKRSPLRAHRAEHDLGYLPRAHSNPSDLTAGTPMDSADRLRLIATPAISRLSERSSLISLVPRRGRVRVPPTGATAAALCSRRRAARGARWLRSQHREERSPCWLSADWMAGKVRAMTAADGGPAARLAGRRSSASCGRTSCPHGPSSRARRFLVSRPQGTKRRPWRCRRVAAGLGWAVWLCQRRRDGIGRQRMAGDPACRPPRVRGRRAGGGGGRGERARRTRSAGC